MDEESQSSIIHILAHTYDDTNRKPAAPISISVWGLRIGTRWEQGHVPDGGDQIWYIEVHMEESDVRLRIIIVKSTFSSFRDIITKRKLRQELAEVFGWLRRECRQPIVNRPELIDDIETRQHLCNARILPREHTGPRTRQKCPTTFADLHRRRTKTNLSKDPTPLRKDRHTSHILTGKPQGQSGQWSSAF
ncbi:hypothetical protein CIHG_07453 [Coccidioides immitis H538.4]|uniref:Uncharacterized protein n=1 Tax=Coccidioides immitis H538.4 TaxID=396776 RepID=A0A0J8RYI4_COCIT|nr:hypothetical protein CIHG_07453 [Coccidioides immitis H538.4]